MWNSGCQRLAGRTKWTHSLLNSKLPVIWARELEFSRRPKVSQVYEREITHNLSHFDWVDCGGKIGRKSWIRNSFRACKATMEIVGTFPPRRSCVFDSSHTPGTAAKIHLHTRPEILTCKRRRAFHAKPFMFMHISQEILIREYYCVWR